MTVVDEYLMGFDPKQKAELVAMAEKMYGNLVKAVVDLQEQSLAQTSLWSLT